MIDVLWLTSAYPWAGDRVGGIFFQAQAQALARAGARITVAAPVPATPWPLPHLRAQWRAHSLAPVDQRDGAVRVLRPRFPNVPGQPDWAQPDRFIADAAWRTRDDWAGARLVHGHYSLVGMAARRLARRAGLPYALTFHGSDLNTWPARHPGRLEDLRMAAREAAAVFTVSEALAERLRTLTGVEAIHLPIGVDHRRIRDATRSPVEARRALGLPPDLLLVLFVGRLVPEKGVRELVTAVLDLGGSMDVVLVGAGPEHGFGADGRPGSDRIRYVGVRSHDEVVTYMNAADVLVLPSYGEGLPTVLVEAGAVGLPVIASSVGGIPELLGDGRGTLLTGVSPRGIGEALRSFRAEPGRARAAARRLHDHVVAEYDVDLNAERLQSHYLGIVAHRGGRQDVGAAAPGAQT